MRKPKKAMDDVSWIRIWELHDKIIRPDGSIYLCTLHRLCGPAVERDNGSKEWWVNGDRHRTNGPAMEEIGDPVRWDSTLEQDRPAVLPVIPQVPVREEDQVAQL